VSVSRAGPRSLGVDQSPTQRFRRFARFVALRASPDALKRIVRSAKGDERFALERLPKKSALVDVGTPGRKEREWIDGMRERRQA